MSGTRREKPASVPGWPALPLADWEATKETLHLWTQIVGKVRLALAPAVNHWWHAPLYPTVRGLSTSAMPYGERTIEMTFDFVHHVLQVETSDGVAEVVRLVPRSVADFYNAVMETLARVGVQVHINRRPVEIADAIPLDADEVHGTYDFDAAHRFWLTVLRVSHELQTFRGAFLGKCSPVHFWWGSFDLSCTRFSGRPAPRHPGGIPNCPDYVTREAYSHECISAGWWPGGGEVAEPAFYAYAYPEPAGYADSVIQPSAASYHPTMGEWILPYEAVRTASAPSTVLQSFLESTYASAAELAGWNRGALERRARVTVLRGHIAATRPRSR